jgi:hypothetical protein
MDLILRPAMPFYNYIFNTINSVSDRETKIEEKVVTEYNDITENINIIPTETYIIVDIYPDDLSIFSTDEWLEIKLLIDVIYDHAKLYTQNGYKKVLDEEEKQEIENACKFLADNNLKNGLDVSNSLEQTGKQVLYKIYETTNNKSITTNQFRKWVSKNYKEIFKNYVVLEQIEEFL